MAVVRRNAAESERFWILDWKSEIYFLLNKTIERMKGNYLLSVNFSVQIKCCFNVCEYRIGINPKSQI
jgi:hypothetical protein